MKLEDLMASLREGRRLRRPKWKDGLHIFVDIHRGVGSDSITKADGASYGTWPSAPMDCYELLADDWEILPGNTLGDDVPPNYRDALDLVLTRVRDGFDPYTLIKNTMKPGPDGVAGLKADADWRNRCKDAMSSFMTAASAKDVESQRSALVTACHEALKAIALHVGEEYVRDVMGR